MDYPLQQQVRESLARFMLAWLAAAVTPCIIWIAVLDVIGLLKAKYTFLGWFDPRYPPMAIGAFFGLCLIAAIGQWWVLRRRLPRPRLWAIMTFAGLSVGIVASAALRDPIVTIDQASPLVVSWIKYLQRFVLIGLASAGMQALVAPVGRLHRLLWIATSLIAGGLASIGIAFAQIATLPRLEFGFAWTIYLLVIGMALYRLIIWKQPQQWNEVAAWFD